MNSSLASKAIDTPAETFEKGSAMASSRRNLRSIALSGRNLSEIYLLLYTAAATSAASVMRTPL